VLRAGALLLVLVGCGERPLEPRDPTPGVPHYKVKTYNVETGRHHDKATIEAVGIDSADIVCLQESDPTWETTLRERYSGIYPYQLYRHNYPNEGAADLGVLSKFPVEESGWHPGPNGWHPAWHVRVHTPSGRIEILNVHLRSAHAGNGNLVSSYLSTKDDHRYEIGQFMGDHDWEGTPVIVLGDFNEGTDGAAVEYLEDRGFRNALPLYHPGQFTWRHDSVANQFTQTLDHILFDGHFEPLNAWVKRAGNSDHIPVVAHLEAADTWPEAPLSTNRNAPSDDFETAFPGSGPSR